MTTVTNAGSNTTDLIGDLPGYPKPVWYDPKGIANILSVRNVSEFYRITFDSKNGNTFTIHKDTGNVNFTQCSSGLYYHDTSMYDAATLITTTKNKQESYTSRQY